MNMSNFLFYPLAALRDLLFIISYPFIFRGAFGAVYLCKEKSTGLELAAKIVPCKKKKEKNDMMREIELMSGLHHPRLIQLYDAFEYQNKVYAILEL